MFYSGFMMAELDSFPLKHLHFIYGDSFSKDGFDMPRN